MKRREFLTVTAATLAAPSLLTGRAHAAEAGAALPIPEIVEIGPGSGNRLEAIAATRDFGTGAVSDTLGYSQDYLGPLLRFQRGQTANIDVTNRTDAPITAHWHGMHVPGHLDGGPQLAFGPDETWSPELPVDHPAATLFYHSHVHGRTADQVYRGLAGMIIIDDPDIDDPLPRDYGVNDFPLIVQDRSFDGAGRLAYDIGMMDLMQGFHGSEIIVNGAIRPKLTVPAGLVRLRLANGSNARMYDFSFTDGRVFHQVASDGGLLAAPVEMTSLSLAAAERAEIVVDFSDRSAVRLISRDVGSGGMMGGGGGGMMGGGTSGSAMLEILSFEVGDTRNPGPTRLPDTLPAAFVDLGEPVRRRDFTLNMHSGNMMGSMLNNLIGRDDQIMGINGSSYDMGRIDQNVPLGETELWRIDADMAMHPFHVHGTSFQVVTQNGRSVDPARIGWKDVIHVQGPTEILLRFDKRATAEAPFMYHCHILEHEDAGMMGQFTVS